MSKITSTCSDCSTVVKYGKAKLIPAAALGMSAITKWIREYVGRCKCVGGRYIIQEVEGSRGWIQYGTEGWSSDR